MASIIVDQVGSAIGQVTLKDSKFNRQGDMGGLSSARRLARKLFASLSDVTPRRSHLVVDGEYSLSTLSDLELRIFKTSFLTSGQPPRL